MCKLVPFKAQTGKTVMVADIKVDVQKSLL